jgi:hypothetical protein
MKRALCGRGNHVDVDKRRLFFPYSKGTHPACRTGHGEVGTLRSNRVDPSDLSTPGRLVGGDADPTKYETWPVIAR